MISTELRNLARLLQSLASGALPVRPEGIRSVTRVLRDLADRVEALENSTVHDPARSVDAGQAAAIRRRVMAELERIVREQGGGEPA